MRCFFLLLSSTAEGKSSGHDDGTAHSESAAYAHARCRFLPAMSSVDCRRSAMRSRLDLCLGPWGSAAGGLFVDSICGRRSIALPLP